MSPPPPDIEFLAKRHCRAYNDMLYLCEKYAPLDSLERYDPEKDISVTGYREPFVISQLD